MKKVLNFLKRNIAIHIVVGAWLGVMGAVYVIYSNAEVSSGLSAGSVTISKANMQDVPEATLQSALDYLYEKASHVGESSGCPDGFTCNKIKAGYLPNQGTYQRLKQSVFVENTLQVGSLIKMTPTATSVKLDGSKTGYTTSNGVSASEDPLPYDINETTLNPQELEYWRVIRKNDDGTIDAVSEYVSSVSVFFYGIPGYTNFIGYLNELASYYENPTYTVGSRHMGYNSQTEYIKNTTAFDGSVTTDTKTDSSPLAPSSTGTPTPTSGTPTQVESLVGAKGDTLYYTDYDLVKNAYGNSGDSSLIAKSASDKTTATTYWIASRRFYHNDASNFHFAGRYINTTGSLYTDNLRGYNNNNGGWMNRSRGHALRPILTLKSTITSSSTESGTGAYILD